MNIGNCVKIVRKMLDGGNYLVDNDGIFYFKCKENIDFLKKLWENCDINNKYEVNKLIDIIKDLSENNDLNVDGWIDWYNVNSRDYWDECKNNYLLNEECLDSYVIDFVRSNKVS